MSLNTQVTFNILGGRNRIVAGNPYYKVFYIFSNFTIPTSIPADILDSIDVQVIVATKSTPRITGCYRILLETNTIICLGENSLSKMTAFYA